VMSQIKKNCRYLPGDGRGASNTAVAALLSVTVIFLCLWFMKTPSGSRTLFISIFELLKYVGILDKNFDPISLLDSPVGELVAYMGSFVGIVLLVAVTFSGTKYSLEIASSILAWRRGRRERQHKEVAQLEERCRPDEFT
jgi:hypothetical protein